VTKLSADTVLRRVPELRVHVDSSGGTKIYVGGGLVECGSYGLTVLDLFSRPSALSAAVEKLKAQVTGSYDWIDLTSTIVRLHQAGVLTEEHTGAEGLKAVAYGYDASPIHAAMLNDRSRTESFLAGIAEVVRPGDVVVDVGTGTGILAMAAARAGASRVYAVEATRIGRHARANFEANGFGDRITLVEGWSTRVTLPERADVLVSEMIGNEPLAESVIEVFNDARARMLKPSPRLVPSSVRVFGLPVEIPRAELARRVFVDESLSAWHSWYGFDFSRLAVAARSSSQVFTIKPHKARGWRILGDPVPLAEIDFRTTTGLAIDTTVRSAAACQGRMSGLVTYFELELGPTARLSTHPGLADESNHWLSPVWVLPQELDLYPGDEMAVSYRYRSGEELCTVRKIES
jgi:hypothetical protein